MSYRYLEDMALADVAFRAAGASREALFAAAADAVAGTMVENLATIRETETVSLHLEEPALDLLLFSFLSEVVYLKDARRLLLRPRSIAITGEGPCVLRAVLAGEAIDPRRHPLLTDVKAVTLHRLSVERTEGGWQATVVLDV
jgi:SHS2 domain-containing protein